MRRRRLRVAVAAEEAAGVQVLHRLTELEHAPEVAVVLTRSPAEGAERPVVFEAARQLGLDVMPSISVTSPDLAPSLRELGIDVLLNVHSLFIFHPAVLAAPRIGSFNLHPGPLPEYAGLNVPSWAIYHGEAEHGVALHWMDAGIDTGPVVWQERLAVDPSETGLSLTAKCTRRGVPLVVQLVVLAADDPAAIPRVDQDLARRRYFPAGPPANGRIDWTADAASILRFVRAADYRPFSSPWGYPVAMVAGREVRVVKAIKLETSATQPPGTVIESSDRGAVVATGDDFVRIEHVASDPVRKPPPMSGV